MNLKLFNQMSPQKAVAPVTSILFDIIYNPKTVHPKLCGAERGSSSLLTKVTSAPFTSA